MSIYGQRARIGYTSPPAATEVFPYEFYKIVPDGVTLVVTTMPLVNRTDDEITTAYDQSSQASAALAAVGVDLIVLGGLPINVSRGVDSLNESSDNISGQTGIRVTSSFESQLAAFKAIGSRKVGICHPYKDTEDARHLRYGDQFGFEPTGALGAGAEFAGLGTIPIEVALELGRAAKAQWPESDTLYFPCPHWAVAGSIQALEDELGVNVITALQAIVWHSLRACGVTDSIAGYGRLLRDF